LASSVLMFLFSKVCPLSDLEGDILTLPNW
jgi:hypothetical protein